MTQSEPPPATPPEDTSHPDPTGSAPTGVRPSGYPPGSTPTGLLPSGYPLPEQWPELRPAASQRPGVVTIASIILIVVGVLTAIVGLFALLAASLFSSGMDIPGLEQFEGTNVAGAIGTIFVVIGAVIIAFGVLQVVSGINLFSARSWARILGIVLAVIGGLFGLLALVPGSNPDTGSPIFGIILLVAYVFVIWALATTGRYFSR